MYVHAKGGLSYFLGVVKRYLGGVWQHELASGSLGSPLIDGIFLVQKMCIYSCVTLSTTLLIHTVQASQADCALNWTACINKVVDRVTQE